MLTHSSMKRAVWVLWLGWVGCQSPETREAALTFPVAHPQVTSTFVEREYVGKVEAVRHVEFRSRLRGFIEAVGVDEGQPVKQGQLLFSISARELAQEVKKAKAAIDSAQAELASAQVEQANTRTLVERKIVSQAELDLANAKVASLAAKLEEARAHEGQASINLSYGQVRAPFDGVVNRIPRKVGSLIAEEEVLTTLTDTSEVFVYFRVSEEEYLDTLANRGHPPKQVTLTLANGAKYEHPGVIDAVETEFDSATGNLAFRARFPNPQAVLKHGATGKVSVRSELTDAVVVPQRSTFEIQENVYVFTLDAEDRARATRIVPRLRLKDGFVVESGVTASDRIVLEGVQKVKDGDRLTVRAAVPSSPSL